MPNLDGTGPLGQGSMTGRRRGRCREMQTEQTEKPVEQNSENNKLVYGYGRGGGRRRSGGMGNRSGRGLGRGGGMGRGRGAKES